MKHSRVSVLLGGALLVASAASAQQRMQGSGIRVSKDAPAVSSTPSSAEMNVTAGTISFTTPFDISAYGALNEKQITMLFAGGDSLEIEIGHLAHSKGTDARVRDFGMMLANDHTAHLKKTWEIITDEDVGIAPIPNNNEGARLRQLLNWLRNNPAGPTWDATLLRYQAEHHQNVIDILNRNIKNAHDDDLEDFIQKTLTSLAKHRDSAKSIAASLGLTLP